MAQASIFSQAQYKNPALVQNAFNHMTYLEDRALEKQHTPDFERLWAIAEIAVYEFNRIKKEQMIQFQADFDESFEAQDTDGLQAQMAQDMPLGEADYF